MATVSGSGEGKKKAWSQWWETQPAGRRKQIVGVLVILGVVVFAYLLASGSGSTTKDATHGKIENALLPTDAARDLGVNGVSNDVREDRADTRELKGELGRLKSQVDRFTQANGTGESTKEQKLQATIDTMRSELDQLKATQASGPTVAQVQQGGAPGKSGAGAMAPSPAPPAYGPIRTIGQDDAAVGSATGATGPGAPNGHTATRPSTVKPPARFYLPSGSFVQAVLLTGVEAATGQAAMKDPVPVLARIKHDAILPNFYSADIRECFVLLDAIGDLASERAMMRSENISCVMKDKSVIDVPIQGYGVGEDGKAGLHGILVSKQGMVLRKAMLAGFADGISKAFGGMSQPSLLGSPGQNVNYGQSLQSGAMGGASSAMDRIAQYYLDLANELHPVIEIESGRQLTLVVVHGRTLATVDPNSASQNPPTQSQPVRQTTSGFGYGGGSTSGTH